MKHVETALNVKVFNPFNLSQDMLGCSIKILRIIIQWPMEYNGFATNQAPASVPFSTGGPVGSW